MKAKSLLRVTLSSLLTLFLAVAAWAQNSPELYYDHVMSPEESVSAFNKIWGKHVDLSVRRPVVDLTGSVFEEKYGARAGSRLYANVNHQGRFWVARIPTEGVKNTYFVMSYFMPIAAHAFLRFEMHEGTPVELIAPMPEALPEKGFFSREDLPEKIESAIRLKDLAMSAEAQWTTDDPKAQYSLVRGALGNFVQIVRMVSLDDRLMEFFRNGNTSRQWKTTLSEREGSEVLRSALRKSETDGAKTFYNTLFYNCTTTAIDMVAEGAPPMSRDGMPLVKRLIFSVNHRLFRLSRAIPVVTGWWGLKIRGLVTKESEVAPLEKDPSLKEAREKALQRLLREKGESALGETANDKKKAYIAEILTGMGQAPLCGALFRSADCQDFRVLPPGAP